jgi:hypothetical protein
MIVNFKVKVHGPQHRLPMFRFGCGKSVEINPANAPAENPGCTSRQTWGGRVALGISRYRMVPPPTFVEAHGGKWREAAGRERHPGKS